MIDDLTALIPESLRSRSGAVFYSGRTAFSAPSRLYILGLNPGGRPQAQANDTVEMHTAKVLNGNQDWSEYQDESWWKGHNPGTSGMQVRRVDAQRVSFGPPAPLKLPGLRVPKSTRASPDQRAPIERTAQKSIHLARIPPRPGHVLRVERLHDLRNRNAIGELLVNTANSLRLRRCDAEARPG